MKKNQKFVSAFGELGSNWILDNELFDILSEFVCLLYGYNETCVDVVRSKKFQRKYKSEGKIVDLSLLPPCRSVLKLHAERANYVAKIWRSSTTSSMEMPIISNHGWESNGDIHWVDDIIPDDIEEVLLDSSLDIDDVQFNDDAPSADDEDEF